MQPDYEIKPGRGIGNILFGTEREELFEMLGDPDEIEIPEETEKLNWESYRYNSIHCAFTFDPDQEDTLVEISVENVSFHIAHKILVGTCKEDLLAMAAELNLGKYIPEDRSDAEFPDREWISFPSAGLKLCMDEGLISLIQISVL